ncbi:MAG: amidohydrolase family protein [Burkholderiales bacterium]
MTVATTPQWQAPPGACDCHMHIFDSRFPLAAKARRKEPDATVAQYRGVQQRLGLSRVVVVQPTAYGRDNRCTLDAIAQLGALGDTARGVAVIDETTTDAEIERLHQAGMRGVRFRMLEPPELPWALLEPMAARLASVGWHIQFQMDGRDFESREAQLMSLPCPLVIEHVGKFLEPVPVSHPGFQSLLRLVDNGRVWVKLSGAYMVSRSGPPFYSDIGVLAKALVQRAPERMVWASNWPHPLPAATTAKPDDAAQLDMLLDWVPEQKTRHRILVENPATLYGFPLA